MVVINIFCIKFNLVVAQVAYSFAESVERQVVKKYEKYEVRKYSRCAGIGLERK